MPTYDWECPKCSEVTAIARPSDDYLKPPEACDRCGNREDLKKIIVRPGAVKGFILIRGIGGFHDHEYTRYRSIK